MNQSKTILKHIFNGVDTSKDAATLALCTHEQVTGYLEEFAEGMWQAAYVQVDYSAVTMPQWRNAALQSVIRLTSKEFKEAENA